MDVCGFSSLQTTEQTEATQLDSPQLDSMSRRRLKHSIGLDQSMTIVNRASDLAGEDDPPAT